MTSGALPAGLTLGANGSLTGTPTASGTFPLTVTVTDTGISGNPPVTQSGSYTLSIAAPSLTLAPATLSGATVGAAYSQTLTASGGTSPYSYAVTAGSLPAGVTLSSGGVLSGTPISGGSFTFTVTATDATASANGGPYNAARSYTLTVAAAQVQIAPASLTAGTYGVAYSQQLNASGGTAPYSYAVTAGAPPAGVTLSSGGVLSGTPMQSGNFTFTVTATDSSTGSGPYSAARSYTLAIAGPMLSLAPATLSGATVGIAYNQQVNASGGTAPYSYAVTAGALPGGVTLSSGGVLSGTPSAGGSFAFTVNATDATSGANGGPYAAARSYTLSVAAAQVQIAPTTLPSATTRIAYSQNLTASGGTAPYSYAITAGALPAGMTLAVNGTLSGSATSAGSYTFTVTAGDSSTGSGPYSGSQSYTLTVGAPAIVLAPSTLPNGTTNVTYTQTLSASGGTAPYGFAVTAGALPAGITLANNGTLTGKATVAGQFSFAVAATDANGNGGALGYTLTVAAPAITLAPTTLPTAITRIAYSQTVTAIGGTGPYGFAVTAGALPVGITLASNGTLSGTAAASGSATFTVTATDGNGNTGVQSYTLTVSAPAITLAPAALADATTGSAYSAAISASGGSAPYSFTVTAGGLPAGIILASDGTLSGTPSAGGTYSFTVTATDANGNAANRGYSLTVASAQVQVAPVTLAVGTYGTAYSQQLSASGGTAPYVYAVTAGALPAGVTLSSVGLLSGAPTQSGNFTFTATATDSSTGSGPYSGARSYTLSIAAPALTLAPATLSGATVGAAFSQTLTASGGTAPYSYALTSGALPAGVTLSGGGILSGTPAAGGSFTFTVTATDATASANGGPYNAARSYTLTVATAQIQVAPASLAAGTAGTAYSQQLGASGGTAPYTYAVTAGALPSGITVSTSGVVSGAPTQSGTFTFTVTATDSSTGSGPYAGGRSYTLTIAAPALTLAPATLGGATVGTAYSQTMTASGGTAPYSYAITAGALPAGLTLSTGGVLSGMPTANGNYTFTVTVTDATAPANGGPYAVSHGYTLAVALPPPPVTRDAPPETVAGSTVAQSQSVAIDLSAQVSGSVSDIQISTPPQHGTATIVQTGGRFVATYTPTAGFGGTDVFSFVAIGAGGRSAPAQVSITVVGAVPVAPSVRATTLSSRPVVLDLTAGVSNGPFTGAQILSVSPADAVTAELIEGGTAGNRTYQLRVTPGGRFSGTAVIQYTISNAFGPSAAATATVTVNARPDPTQDATVRGLVSAQADTTRRFATTQTDNFMRRAEQLHGGDQGANRGRPSFGISFNAPLPHIGANGSAGSPVVDDFTRLKMDHATSVMGAERSAGLLTTGRDGALIAATDIAGARGRAIRSSSMMGVNGSAANATANGADLGSGGDGSTAVDRKVGSVAMWSGGAITLGVRDATTHRVKLSATTSGLSAGVDLKLTDGLIVGAGGGYGHDHTKLGDDAGQIDSDDWSAVLYASSAPAEGLFVDGVLGLGHLKFSTLRFVPDGAVANGHRDGSMLFGSLSTGFDHTTNQWMLSAYGRVDYLHASLDQYVESGGGIYALAFDKRAVESLSGVLGLRTSYAVGAWTPRLRLEYRHEFDGSGVQALDYAGLSGYAYRIANEPWVRDSLTAEIGTELRLGGSWKLGADIGGSLGNNSRSATGKATIAHEF